MPNLYHPETCTGCSACAAICPNGSIQMVLNEEGFYEPSIRSDTCLECGACVKACPVEKAESAVSIASYYGYQDDPAVERYSTSGGAFRALADSVTQEGGLVFGAVYTPDFREVIFESTATRDITDLQKSKYIASNADGVFRQIKELLTAGKKVLFCGAPCQVAGLKSYLNGGHENLLTVDFICGGMSSVKFWREHIDALQKQYRSEIDKVDFRSKKMGWGKCVLEIGFKSGKTITKREYLDSYYSCFVHHKISVREGCIRCTFSDAHAADITIADFWGYRAAKVAYRSGGLSLLLVNTKAGAAALEQLKGFSLFPLQEKDSAYVIGKRVPDPMHLQKRGEFFAFAEEAGFEKAARKMYPATYLEQCKQLIRTKLHRG